jgi:hypothetical protein
MLTLPAVVTGPGSDQEPQRAGLFSRVLDLLPGRANRAASYTPNEPSSRDSTPRQAAQLSDGSAPEVVSCAFGTYWAGLLADN